MMNDVSDAQQDGKVQCAPNIPQRWIDNTFFFVVRRQRILQINSVIFTVRETVPEQFIELRSKTIHLNHGTSPTGPALRFSPEHG